MGATASNPFAQGRAAWIWSAERLPLRNAFVRLRRRFGYTGGPALLHITADSRYALYVNGHYLGQGPVRAWPAHWHYDTYDLQPYLQAGDNILAVLVQHYGEGDFQYVAAPAGLLAQIHLGEEVIATDSSWRASPDAAFISAVPRIDVQEAFEEQYDARLADDWTAPGYDDAAWPPAQVLRPAMDGHHEDLAPRGIPFLTLEPLLPKRVVSVEATRSVPYRHTVYVRPYLVPGDLSANAVACHAYLATRVWSPVAGQVRFSIPHKGPSAIRVNGEEVRDSTAHLRAGWNDLVASLCGVWHLPEFAIALEGPEGLRFSADGSESGPAWAVVGPFALSEHDRHQYARTYNSPLVAEPLCAAATGERGDEFWRSGDVPAVVDEPFFQPVRPEHLPAEDVFVQAYTDQPAGDGVTVECAEALLSGAEWATVQPPEGGADVRILLDYGREVVGFQRFEVYAPAGTVIDLHNLEFIQPDGRYNLAEGMNNSARYVCRAGYQAYQTFVRRGFRYTYLILRHVRGPVRLRRVEAVLNTYPQSCRGSFACSDARLEQIWEVGAQTLECCAEDTYTDCPTYEQTHWVGDARNEALIDWAINGDPRLWFRCLEQTGQSLDRSPLTESHVPSAWQNILPAWSFLWMRSCREYLLFSGDREGSLRLLEYVERNVAGIEQHLNPQGLFEIRAWNMFDWAEMDTPNEGVVTHQNCLAVHALHDAAELAQWLERPQLAVSWRALAADLSDAVNRYLWSEELGAYTDCLRGGRHSPVFSQQTQTVAYASGVATGERAARCREIMADPPEGFVRAGSPFFEFFLLEAYQAEGREQALLDTIRRDWGFMVEMGATTFWEMWSGHSGRLTRSHCHGWSAAPTFFLSTYALGVRPGDPGFRPAIVEPHPGDLAWCRGTMPTPAGDIEVQWENRPGQPFSLRIRAPEGLPVEVRLPREGHVTLNGRSV